MKHNNGILSLKFGLSSVRSFTTTVFWYSDPGLKYSLYIERVIYNACIKHVIYNVTISAVGLESRECGRRDPSR
jgi:hypothetical protein